MALHSAIITVMQKAAEKAGRKLSRDFGEVEHLQVSRKGPADFVSAADTRAEKIIFEELSRARPDFGFLMEENGEIEGNDKSTRWIIDPLDGTTNFLHSIPHFCTSIALEQNGEITAGLLYLPLTDETYWAEKGRGAYLGNRRLRVSSRKNMADSLLATGIPFKGRAGHAEFIASLETIMPEVAGVRRFGSAALDLAYVAAGRYDGFWETELQPWDIAAGLLLVSEAGGQVTTFDGKKDVLDGKQILATNGALHGPVTRLLATARKNVRKSATR
ncbi:inositol monophosphatase family protein [Emcibacter sp.]|uniref:inositol monophosphatase family protein n=1 Tax=Emcibacter sp. TaxID=1979954 RepID=UPI002AA78627|nr:inositol monophosphatase family protein [Emcibacter sp.]